MSKGIKIGLIVLAVLGLGFLGLCVWGYRLVTGSLPVTQGEIALPDLHEEVRVYRDGYNIPHIIATNDYDLFYAQGFVTAQDRLWQMDLRRRTAKGQLTEIFGRQALQTDSMMITIGLKHTARLIVPQLSRESREVYQAYTDGINGYIEMFAKRPPVEFSLRNYKPSPWTIEDCVAILRLFGWQMSSRWMTDFTLGMIAEKVGMNHLTQLFPNDKDKIPSDLPWQNHSLTSLFQHVTWLHTRQMFPGYFYEGNGWVIAGNRSVTEKPLLVNDIQLPLMVPSHWYEIHLVGGEFNVSGFSYPGLPMIFAGYNQNIAWGITNLSADQTDLFIETLDPYDSTRVLMNESYEPTEIIEDEIPQKFASPIRTVVQKTRHGPIIAKVLTVTDSGPVALSLRWTGHEVSDEGRALYYLNRARNWKAFKEALKDFKSPCLNVLFADRDGNIGIQAVGTIPRHTNGVGFIPHLGDNPSTDWKGHIPYDDLPSAFNPEEGFITSANNPVSSQISRYFIFDYYDRHSRIRRINQLFSEEQKVSVMDLKTLRNDNLSIFAGDILDLVLPDLSNDVSNDSLEMELIEKLSQWDGQMKAGSLEAALFEVFLGKLTRNIFRDEMGDSLYTACMECQSIPLSSLKHLLKKKSASWFDNVRTQNVIELKNDIVRRSFHDAIGFLRKTLGKDDNKWTWGELHTLIFRHPMGHHPFLGKTFNLGSFHVGGTNTTINNTEYIRNDDYLVVSGASARMIVDLSNLDNSISVIPTGQSGQPLDQHYRDQLQLYLGNLYHPNLVDTTKIVRSGWKHLKLKPGTLND